MKRHILLSVLCGSLVALITGCTKTQPTASQPKDTEFMVSIARVTQIIRPTSDDDTLTWKADPASGITSFAVIFTDLNNIPCASGLTDHRLISDPTQTPPVATCKLKAPGAEQTLTYVVRICVGGTPKYESGSCGTPGSANEIPTIPMHVIPCGGCKFKEPQQLPQLSSEPQRQPTPGSPIENEIKQIVLSCADLRITPKELKVSPNSFVGWSIEDGENKWQVSFDQSGGSPCIDAGMPSSDRANLCHIAPDKTGSFTYRLTGLREPKNCSSEGVITVNSQIPRTEGHPHR